MKVRAGRVRVLVALMVTTAFGLLGATGAAAKSTTTTTGRPDGPAATISPLTGGNGVFLGEGTPPDLKSEGYVQREYSASGTASAYDAGSTGFSADGKWMFSPAGTAPYVTRVVVRAPADLKKFSGNVIVEWLNVSGGVDANPEWVSTAEEIVRSGDAWVGVSAQRIGVEGGPVAVKVDVPGAEAAGKGLKAIDPTRYGSLVHPGDGYAFDIYTQVARAVRDGDVLGAMKPKRVIAGGESQSAFALVGYYNGVQPATEVFDGFFVHSRGAAALPLASTSANTGIADAIRGTPVVFRDDVAAPVMDLQTETDVASVLNSYAARQDDSKTFRLWEVAGTAHADKHLVGAYADQIPCGVPINNGPLHIVAKAAYHHLKTWVATGKAPVAAPRIDVSTSPPVAVSRDRDGIAQGGIRTPPVDVPVVALSGAPGPNPSTICLLLGSSTPLSAERIAALYPSRAAYMKMYKAATDAAIKAGFVLPADKTALLGFAQPDLVSG